MTHADLMNDFWAYVEDQIRRLCKATTADEVLAICPRTSNADGAADGFFGGSGGDEQVCYALDTAGWNYVWIEAEYFWCMQAPNGDLITYVEGDLYRGNRKPLPHGFPEEDHGEVDGP